MKIKKAIYIILAIVLLTCVMSGCFRIEKPDEEIVKPDEEIVKPDVASINGENITMDEYNYFLHNLQASYEAGYGNQGIDMETVWATEKDGKSTYDIMKKNAYDQMIDCYILAAEAKKAKITVDSSEINRIKAQMMSGFPSESAFLEEYEMNSSGFNKAAEQIALSGKYQEYLKNEKIIDVTDEEIETEYKDTYMKAKHILFSTVDGSQQPLSEEETAAKKTLAEEVLARAKAGENFDELMNEYSEDPGIQSNPDGYVFTEGQMVGEFEEATKALKPGEISDIVESQYGYHIIKRLEPDTDPENEEYQSIVRQISDSLFSDKLSEKIEEFKKGYTVKDLKEVEKIKRK